MQELIHTLGYYVFVPAAAFATGLIILSYGISKVLSLFDIKSK